LPSLFVVVNGFDITVDKPFVYYFDAATGDDGYRNYQRMGTRGVELELRFKSDHAFANASYSFYTTAGKDRIAPLAVPDHDHVLLGFAPHKLALLAGYRIMRALDASVSGTLLAGQRWGYSGYDGSGAPVANDYGSELLLNAFVSYKDLGVRGSFVGIGVQNLTNSKAVLIQPFNNGHPPLPGPSREIFLRVGYDQRWQNR
jgi:outer membrane receptor protein involved in Fe transport